MKKWSIILLYFLSVTAGIFAVSSEVNAASARWVLTDVLEYNGEEYVNATNEGGIYEASSNSELGNYSYKWKYLGGADNYYDPPLLEGENSESKASFSTPPRTIQGGESVTLSVELKFGEQILSYFSDKATANADFEKWDIEPGYTTGSSIPFKNKDGKSLFKIDTYKTVKVYSLKDSIMAKATVGLKEGDRIALRTMFNGVKQGTCYIYEWSSTKNPINIPKPQTPGNDGLKDSGVRFSDLYGEVSIKHAGEDDDSYEFAELDMVIYEGDIIRVKEESGIVLSRADMSTFEMNSEGLLVVNTFNEKENKLKLLAGNIYTNVKKMIVDGTMEVEMSQAVAGIKGTTFICEERGDTSTLKVLEGKVDFTSKKSGKLITVNAGEMAVADEKGNLSKSSLNIDSEAKKWDKIIIELKIGQKTMKVNGIQREVDPGRETKPVIIQNRTLIPIRAVIEAMGGTVDYNSPDKKITLKKDKDVLEMWIGKTTIKFNGVARSMDVAPTILNNRTFVPVRFVAENFGYSVSWKALEKKIIIQ